MSMFIRSKLKKKKGTWVEKIDLNSKYLCFYCIIVSLLPPYSFYLLRQYLFRIEIVDNFCIIFFQTQSKEENSESEKDDNDSGNEKEEPGIQTSKKISKTMKKNISKSISELQTLKQKSKNSVAKVRKASKYQKKTAKSKRSKHYHPKKNTK